MVMAPEWTQEQIGLVRALARKGVPLSEVKDHFDTPLAPDGIRRRAGKYGIKFNSSKRAHLGNTGLACNLRSGSRPPKVSSVAPDSRE